MNKISKIRKLITAIITIAIVMLIIVISTKIRNIQSYLISLKAITATFTLSPETETTYKVQYYVENIESNDSSNPENYTLQEEITENGTVNTDATAQVKTYTGFTYDENNINNVKTDKIKQNGKSVLKIYYTRNSYKLTLEKDNYIDTVTGAGNYKYEQTITISATLNPDLGSTFAFAKWESSNTELVAEASTATANITMPAGDVTLKAKLNYGQKVNYNVTVNGVNLNDWELFLKDDDGYAYMIYGDYLPNAAIPQAAKTSGHLNTNGTYRVWSTTSRADLINAMKTESYWSSYITSDLATSATNAGKTATATGGVTVTQFKKSWNDQYTASQGQITVTGDEVNGWTGNTLGSTAGYGVAEANNLYFPHKSDVSDGQYPAHSYWLASPAVSQSYESMYIHSAGALAYNGYYWYEDRVFRPLIRIPTSLLELNENGTSWNIKKISLVEMPTAVEGLIYNGSEQTGVVSESELYTLTNNTATEAGTYTATASLINNTDKWEDGTNEDKEIEYTIEKATLTPSVFAEGYSNDGLLIRLDGYDNQANGEHNGSATTWTNIKDSSKKYNLNNTTWGKNYLEFDGSNSWVNLGQANCSTVTHEVTFSLDTIQLCSIIGNWQFGGGGISVSNEGQISASYHINGSYQYLHSGVFVETGKVYNVAVTYDGTVYILYVNGEEKARDTLNGTISNPQNNTVLALGTNPDGSEPAGELLQGRIYSVSVYNRGLTKEEIKNYSKADLIIAAETMLYTKKYDGTKDLNDGIIQLDGIIGTDDVDVTATYEYETPTVGTNKTIYVTIQELTGEDSQNYKLSTNLLETTGIILIGERTITIPESITTYLDETEDVTFEYTGDAVAATIVVEEDNLATATITNETGTGTISILGKEMGSTNITITIPATTQYNELTKTVTLTVKEKVVATTIIGNVTTGYSTVQEAIDAAPTDGTQATIKLICKNNSIEENVNIPEGKNIILDLNGKEIMSSTTQTIHCYGSLKIIDSIGTGGVTSTVASAIKIDGGTLTLGEDDNIVDKISPKINGGTYGICFESSSYTLNYYDGVVMGHTQVAVNHVANNKPEGYMLVTESCWDNNKKSEKVYLEKTSEDIVINTEKMYVTDGLQVRVDGSHNSLDGLNRNSNTWLDLKSNTTKNVTSKKSWSNNSLVFDGSSTWVNLGIQNGDYRTMHLTFSTTNTTSYQEVFNNFQAGGGGIVIESGYIKGNLYIDGYKVVDSGVKIVEGEIYDVSLNYDGSAIYIYVNGELKNQLYVSGKIKSPDNTIMAIGANPSDNGLDNRPSWFEGTVYTAAVYNRSLTEDEVKQNSTAALAMAGKMVEANEITYSIIFKDTVTGFDIDDIELSIGTKEELQTIEEGKYYVLKTSIDHSELENTNKQTVTIKENSVTYEGDNTNNEFSKSFYYEN